MPIPEHGTAASDVLARLEAMTTDDVRWRDGRAFTLTYNAGPEVIALQREAYARFAHENALNTDAFPSLRTIQADVVDMVVDLLHGDSAACGFMTSGGTESILMAVRAAKQRGATERGIDAPEMILPASAHAAFEKAADYFGVRSIRVPVMADWRADPHAMAEHLTDNTVLIVASAPQYPQGVIDDVAAIAAMAATRDINCHVDACMGGITLPHLARAGYDIPAFDFTVPGVSSISVDLHKYGYTSKGASVIAYRNKHLRRHQTFITDNWLGGLYGSSGMLGTKSGGAMASAWAVMHHLGTDGYVRLTTQAKVACDAIARGIEAIDGLELRAWPQATLFAFGSSRYDIYAVGDALWRRGWYLDRQGPPPSLHCTVNAVHGPLVEEFLSDLAASVDDVRANNVIGDGGAYGTVE